MQNYNEDLILKANPFRIMSILNRADQYIEFYRHPSGSDSDPIVGMIEGVGFITDFYEIGNFYTDSDYLPVLLVNGTVISQYEVGLEND